MATATEIQTAYKAIYRADLNVTVATAIANTGISLDAYIAQQLPQVASTTQAAVAIASFVTGTTPTSAKLDALKIEADKQVASYTALGVGNPSLGAYEAFGRSFATDASTTAGFNTKYGALSTADFITLVYAQVYGTTPSAGAAANLTAQINYFTNLYTTNGVANAALAAKGAVLGQIVGYAFVSSASANSVLDNQVASVLSSAAKGDTTVYNKALPAAVDPGAVGVSITITGAEVVGPTVADPALKTTANNDTITGTITTGSIDGGLGTDTAVLSYTATTAVVGPPAVPAADLAPTLANVEILQLNAAAGGTGAFSLANANSVSEVTYKDSVIAGTVNNIKLGTIIGVTDTTAASDTASATFVFKDATGSTDSATLNLNGAAGTTAPTITVQAIETLNVNATGVASNVILVDSALKALNITAAKNFTADVTASTALESVVATGAGSVALGAISNTTKTIDASGLTGTTGLSFSIAAGNALESVKASGGIDNFTIATTNKALAIDLGAGNDTLSYTQTNTTASSVFGEVIAGAGADNITLSNTGSATTAFSTQKVTLGAGADLLTLNDNGSNVQTTIVYTGTDSTLTFADAITGFKTGATATTTAVADKIDVSAFALGTATVSYTAAALPVADSANLFTGAGTNVIAYDVAGAAPGSDVMLLIDSNKDGSFTLGTDIAIRLVGVNHTDVTAANFTV